MRLLQNMACGVLLVAMMAPGAPAAEPAAGLELFERSIRPVLVEKCLGCHGPKKQESNLRLDSRAAAIRGGDLGPALTPGKPSSSPLLQAVRKTGDLQMPPQGKLAPQEIAALESWISLGAPWPEGELKFRDPREAARTHWAFQPIRDPPPPKLPSGEQPTNPLDAFIRARLHERGLKPAPPADRRTLIRRVTFDLIGLPPTPVEVEAFVRDEHPEAYSRLVERLLASPHYGEQWGRHWLDVARYSDTKGYVYAREHRFWVHASAYRDWVVRSLNDDLPYNQFLTLQIAADQASRDPALPQATEHLAAMGFLTLGRRFLGVTHDIIDDRIDVVTRGALGLTVACARCHDHKYDPIPTQDYYSLYGVFQNSIERDLPLAEPKAESDAQRAFAQEWTKRREKLAHLLAQRRAETESRVRNRVGDYLFAQTELHKYPEEGFDQILTKTDILPPFVRQWRSFLETLPRAENNQPNDPIFAPWQAYRDLPAEQFAELAAASLQFPNLNPLVAAEFSAPPKSLSEVAERYNKLFAGIEKAWRKELAAAEKSKNSPPTRLPDDHAEALRQVLYADSSPCVIPPGGIVNIERFFDLQSCEELWRTQGEVDKWVRESPLAPPHAVILEDAPILTPAHVFLRGKPSSPGDEAPRRFLSLLAGANRQPFSLGSGRWELAQAIVDPANPLTARVLVNRVWQHHFGAGLVRTPSDFGLRAEAPSHPELLDWLAARFIEDGWRLKPLHRRIVLSDTYRQSALGADDNTARQRAQQLDPENRLLWRATPRRLAFEELRDALFAVTGELDATAGGKPGDLFAAGFKRRSLYGLVDRQFLPGTLRVFDFANPDLHIPQRADTTVPQQALFFLNHELVLGRARTLAAKLPLETAAEARIRQLFAWIYQREPTSTQLAAALAHLQASEAADDAAPSLTSAAWSYGFAAYDAEKQRSAGFTRLPHFTGAAWQGGPNWPDAKLGWVQLTASGGHAGNDVEHAAVRRWTAPRNLKLRIQSVLKHDTTAGDGVRGRLISSRHGLLQESLVHNREQAFHAEQLELQTGDTLDFAVDIGGNLNNDQFVWEASLTEILPQTDQPAAAPFAWISRADFTGPAIHRLTRWEQLAQVLLAANEFYFID
jgi:cytochrome c553